MNPKNHKIKLNDDTNEWYLSIALDMAPACKYYPPETKSFSLKTIIEIDNEEKEAQVTKMDGAGGLQGNTIMYYPVIIDFGDSISPGMVYSPIDNPKESWITMFT